MLWLLGSNVSWSDDVAVPPLTGHVIDLTNTLSLEEHQMLSNKLAALETRKGSQLVVLIVPTTQPEDIAQFGIRLAERWKLGRNKVDDGIILIIAKDDRKLRIEVGYGLEGVIPDAIAKRITSEIITPKFKAGDFIGGINAGVDQIIKLIDGEPLPAPANTSSEPEGNLFMLIVIVGIVMGWLLSLLIGKPLGGLVAALGSGTLAAWLIGTSVAFIIALIVFFMVGVRQTSHRSSGWSSGGFGGGSLGGGDSWGGGGGGFGGGGASDSW